MPEMENYLKCTEFIDCDTESIRDKARELTTGLQTDREKAVALYYFVRDEIKHNPYAPSYEPENYRASLILERGNGFCQHKALLLVALARDVGIPARPGYVDVRDHLLSEKFRKMIGGDNLLIQHGYAELYLDGRWVHTSPAYDLETCQKAGFVPVEFDGVNDAKDSAYDREGRPHIEHVKDHGHFDDFPFDYMRNYQREWVARIGREWTEFRDNVKNHEVT
ncbi:MAG: transglutaminase domain-containing protein [Dehalococcoidia bacterium]|nr:MAG: transglutaminase domain-containing protein [Dehalococcoidia bacterium]